MTGRNVTSLLESGVGPESMVLLRRLGGLADDAGVSAYVVGGVVRDALLGKSNEDLDIVVEESGEAFAERAAAELGGSVKAHTRFGTAILVLPGGRKIDVATSRGEAYDRPGALPTVGPGGIEEDLKRRDFTVNSMAVRLGRETFGELVDLFGGEDDLKRGVLRVLTDRSFIDDPTRVLRGVRFAARFGFVFDGRSEELLREAIAGDNLSTISGERIMNEVVLILRERSPWAPVGRLIDWKILAAVHGSWRLDASLESAFDGVASCLASGPAPGVVDPEDAWTVYLLAMLEPLEPESRREVLRRLRAGRRLNGLTASLEAFEARGLPVLSSERDLRRSEVYDAARAAAPEVLTLFLATGRGTRLAERIALHLSELRGVRTSVDGDELAGLGVSEGCAVGEILETLLRARLDGTVGTDEEELELASELAKDLDARNKSC